MAVTKSRKLIGFEAMDVTKSYKSLGSGAGLVPVLRADPGLGQTPQLQM